MRPLLLLLGACAGEADLPAEWTSIEGPSGVGLELDPASLPEGVSLDDISIELVSPDEAEALSPTVRLLPAGLELSSPARLTLPLWALDGLRSEASVLEAADGDVHLVASAQRACKGTPASWLEACVLDFIQAANPQPPEDPQQAGLCPDPTGAAPAGWDGDAQGFAEDFASEPAGYAYLADHGLVPRDGDKSSDATLADAEGGAAPSTVRFSNVGFSDDGSQVLWDIRWFDQYGVQVVSLDEDGNGIGDIMEGATDLDGDGLINPLDWDDDGDRVADSEESICDADADGEPAFQDIDRDGDGVGDGRAECGTLGGCGCGFRVEGERGICYVGDLADCRDEVADGVFYEHELVVGGCPPADEALGGARCVLNSGEPMEIYSGSSDLVSLFCTSCDPATVSPAGFCGAPD